MKRLRNPKTSLQKLKIINSNIKVLRTTYDREEIENTLIQYKRKHFWKAKNTPVHKDKNTKYLHKDKVRNKILNGTLSRDDIDKKDICDFFKLLRQTRSKPINTTEFNPITKEEWS